MNNLKLLALLCCTLCSFISSAQQSKQIDSVAITRERFIIDIYDTTNPNTQKVLGHTLDFNFNGANGLPYFENYITLKFDTLYPDLPFKDSSAASFPEYILDLILRRKLNAYSLLLTDTRPLSVSDVFGIHFTPPGIFHMEDPVTGAAIAVPMYGKSIDFHRITQLRVLTDKMYDPKTKKSSWKIIAITPLKAIYDDNGAFQGKAGLYKIKYADLKPIIAAYEKLHKECVISKGIQNILDGNGVKIED